MSISTTFGSPAATHPATLLFGTPPPTAPAQTPLATTPVATTPPVRDPAVPRLHPGSREPLPLADWLSARGDTSAQETHVRFFAATPKAELDSRLADLDATSTDRSSKTAKRKRKNLTATMYAESLVRSDTTWAIHSQMEAAGLLRPPALSPLLSPAAVPDGLTKAIEALADAAGNRTSSSASAPTQPVAVTPAMLRAPYGIATFLENIRLELDGQPSPARQLKFAMRSLDDASRQFVREEQQDTGKKLQSLDELAKVLAMCYPTDDELLRSHECVLSHLTSRPVSIEAWYEWARSLVRANSAHARGTEKFPAGAVLAILLLGLANVPGACSPAGIHMHLRKDAKTNAAGTIVLAGNLSDPRGLIDYVRKWHQKVEQSSRASKTLEKSRPKRATAAAALTSPPASAWAFDDTQHDTNTRELGYFYDPPPAVTEQPWPASPPTTHSSALPVHTDKPGPCAKCGAAHHLKDCRGRFVPGGPEGVGARAPDAPCVRHSYAGRPPATHTNAQCSLPPDAPDPTPPPRYNRARFQNKRQRTTPPAGQPPRRRWSERTAAFLTTVAAFPSVPPTFEVASELASAEDLWSDPASSYLEIATHDQYAHPSPAVVQELANCQ